MSSAPATDRDTGLRLAAGIFAVVLGCHLWAISVGWNHVDLPGYEFRQAQTALSAHHIQKESDFSFAYPTPVLGKPWSIPFEFPLYQWSAVGISDALGLPLVQAGRLVSVLCLYLSLPALYLLLRRWRLSASESLIVTGLVLACPLYAFYARAFLIETMALMAAVWYLLALQVAVDRRNLTWAALATVAGAAAGLVKVTTFIVVLLPAFIWSVRALVRAAGPRTARNPRAFGLTLAWLAGIHLLPFALTLAWLDFADAVKALNPSGAELRSDQLLAWNFGLGQRFSPAVWTQIAGIVTEQIASPIVLAFGAIAAIFAPQRRRAAAGLIGLYLAVLLIFPVLYSTHAYYHVAAAFLPVIALGLVFTEAVSRSRFPNSSALALWVVIFAAQAHAFTRVHLPLYAQPGNGGGLAAVLQATLQEDEILVIAGDDWSSILPYYSERRALMIRNGREHDEAFLARTFAALDGETVGALILFEGQQDNLRLIELAGDAFDINPREMLTWKDRGREATVYLNRQIESETLTRIRAIGGFHQIEVINSSVPPGPALSARDLAYSQLIDRHRGLFARMTPKPDRFHFTFEPELWNADQPGSERLAVHPETSLWFALPAGRFRLRTDLDFNPGAWQGVPYADATDGISISISALMADGSRQQLYRRMIDPRSQLSDRGVQSIVLSFELPAGAELELRIDAGPAGNGARDWCSLGALLIEPDGP